MSSPALGGILHHNIPDKQTLYASYMPFIKNGGLFVPGHTQHELGKELFLMLTMMGNPERIAVACRVVWITPEGTQGNQLPGIGVQFSDMDKGQTRARIENYLAGALGGDKSTYTL
ncbi:MAG: PilZ domain-containing protein [Halothiobacillaceae bacterium]|jgi:type IV pilus assembly protein PilZ|nr:PilZ domain-containing protein [Halothiobacillaceae bacterium]MDY0050407.1 PilZ domain-containing protein [Halothiobacillaceae bacterium]